MPNKLTDAEVKKALECCSTYHDVSSCKNCPLDGKCEPNMLEQYALDLINRQEEENESLKAEIQELKTEINMFRGYDEEIKAEAYKEFAERLKEYATQGFWETDAYVGAEQIDNLLNELVGEDNESKA